MTAERPRHSIVERVIDAILPRACAACGRRLDLDEEVICATCDLNLPRTLYYRDPQTNKMAQAFYGKLDVERCSALFYFHPTSDISRAVYAMKYGGRDDIAAYLGRLTAQEMLPSGFFDGIDVLVPIPLARRKQRRRGYNQSEMIARGIAAETSLPVATDAVVRTKETKTQTALNAMQRMDNVEGAFALTNADALRGRHVLIVDDIVTTGATITACARAAQRAGDVRISVLSVGFARI